MPVHCISRSRYPWLLAAFAPLVIFAACINPFAGNSSGTVRVRVVDQAGVAVPGARVAVSETNDSGGEFSVSQLTSADGTTTLGGIQVGSRRVTVTPPAGYTAAADPLSKLVTVANSHTVDVSFVLQRATAARRGVLTGRRGSAPPARS
ncbi:MAG TPA: carboxypeptidase-like regulatory domain-containing protein [Gemmatimonadaceae bacterium]|nr:carboxypeptidase-like regulatory domain-containing protein [Gemmatimonadaceae bacterium]